jgi:hypothetical protein
VRPKTSSSADENAGFWFPASSSIAYDGGIPSDFLFSLLRRPSLGRTQSKMRSSSPSLPIGCRRHIGRLPRRPSSAISAAPRLVIASSAAAGV